VTPSVVKQKVAPPVTLLSETFCVALYVPAAGAKAGGETWLGSSGTVLLPAAFLFQKSPKLRQLAERRDTSKTSSKAIFFRRPVAGAPAEIEVAMVADTVVIGRRPRQKVNRFWKICPVPRFALRKNQRTGVFANSGVLVSR
ncbi:MAG TPA: hypothetical protein PKI36_08900, partial [Turneriella sp.]|nr:hypothetical protein [Turneriella sp.]